MFERRNPEQEQPDMAVLAIKRAQISQIEPHEILVDGLTPVEFTFRGRRQFFNEDIHASREWDLTLTSPAPITSGLSNLKTSEIVREIIHPYLDGSVALVCEVFLCVRLAHGNSVLSTENIH
jgi:hypothetical protein